jgi:hypothetical protein
MIRNNHVRIRKGLAGYQPVSAGKTCKLSSLAEIEGIGIE